MKCEYCNFKGKLGTTLVEHEDIYLCKKCHRDAHSVLKREKKKFNIKLIVTSAVLSYAVWIAMHLLVYSFSYFDIFMFTLKMLIAAVELAFFFVLAYYLLQLVLNALEKKWGRNEKTKKVN